MRLLNLALIVPPITKSPKWGPGAKKFSVMLADSKES